MSKNSQNKQYYEIGVMWGGTLIAEYVTTLPIIKGENMIHEKIMQFVHKNHGDGVFVLWNKKMGKLPNDSRPRINIRIPSQILKYNR